MPERHIAERILHHPADQQLTGGHGVPLVHLGFPGEHLDPQNLTRNIRLHVARFFPRLHVGLLDSLRQLDVRRAPLRIDRQP